LGFCSVEEAIDRIREGQMVIVLDDEDRENEGDLTVAAEKVTPEIINFMAKHGRGLVCLALTDERVDQLRLPMMVDENTSKFGTAFTVSIDARRGISTGISAADRATTILAAVNPNAQPSDLVRPGHIFPLRARSGGVLTRAGQTEAGVDLPRLAGLFPAGVICEIMKDDGTMARVPELREIARQHGLKMVTVADIISFRLRTETFVRKTAEACLATDYGEFRAAVFESTLDGESHVVLIKGDIRPNEPVLVRVQRQSTIGDVFRACGSDSGRRLRAALRAISEKGAGVLVYLRQEGHGAALAEDLRLCAHAEATSSQTSASGDSKPDLRSYGLGAQILRELGVRQIRVLTSQPKKMIALQGYGLTVLEHVPLDPD
jgi:3,4-dihydroxy 2-butanone 4-phosphate synthase/GTP cyclohydrolase II